MSAAVDHEPPTPPIPLMLLREHQGQEVLINFGASVAFGVVRIASIHVG